MKTIFEFLTESPVRFFIGTFLIWGALMSFLNYQDAENFNWHDLLVEANGMLFDLIVFGILFAVYDAARQKKEKINYLKSEISTYRLWKSEEASVRIVQAVKEMINEGYTKNIDLRNCFLQNAQLDGLDLQMLLLDKADLTNANLSRSKIFNLAAEIADFSNTDFSHSELTLALTTFSKFEGTNFRNAKLSEIALIPAESFKGADFTGTIFGKDVIVTENWFEEMEKMEVIGLNGIKKYYRITRPIGPLGPDFNCYLVRITD